MISNEIYLDIKQAEQKCIEKAEEENTEAKFFEIFLDENTYNGYDFYLNLDIADFAVAYLCSKNINMSFEETYQKVQDNYEIFENSSSMSIRLISTILEAIIESGDREEFDVALENKNKKKSLYNIKNFFKKDDQAYSMISDILETSNDHVYSLIGLLDIIEESPAEYNDLISLISAIKNIQEDYAEYEEDLEAFKEENNIKNIRDKDKKLLFQKSIKQDYKVGEMSKTIADVKAYGFNLIRNENKNKKKANISLKNYLNLENYLLKANEQNKLITINEYIKKIDDENLKLEILKAIYKHNIFIEKEVEQEYIKESKNTEANFNKLFNDYGISMNNQNMVLTRTYEETKLILEKLKELQMLDAENIFEIINKTDQEILTNIKKINDSGYLNKKFYQENIEMFYKDSEIYTNMIKNIQILKTNRLSPTVVIKDPAILIENPTIIKGNMETLSTYGMTSSIKKSSSLSYLGQEKLEEKIDFFIEQGYEKLLKEDMSILKYNESLKKLIVLNRLNIKVETKEQLQEVLATENYLRNNNLDDYIFNSNEYIEYLNNSNKKIEKATLTNILSEYLQSKNVYDLNGVLISKNKVERNLSELNDEITESDALSAICQNSFLDLEEYQTIKKIISPKQKIK